MDLACDTVTMDNTQTENLQQFNLKFQRDINRLTDADRSSRKRGLQNLVDTLPWNRKTDIEQFLLLNLQTIISLIADPVEKCRELSIKIFIKIFDNNIVLTSIQLQNIIEAVCQRINKIPFPEPSEEIRFQIIELIRLFTSDSYFHLLQSSDTSRTFIFGALTKALHDNFPNSKRSAAEAIIDFAMKFPFVIRMNPGPVMTSLLANGLHQHSKTRVITLKAIGVCLACTSEADFIALMEEGVLTLLGHSIADSTASVRLELGRLCEYVLSQRFTRVFAIVEPDLQLLSVLLMLSRDDAAEVCNTATQGLSNVAEAWIKGGMAAAVSKEVNEEVTDGESELRQLTTVIQNHPNAPMDVCYDPEQSQHQVTGRMVSFYTSQLVPIFLHGIVSWTTESRIRYLRGLYSLISLLRTQVLPYLPDTLQSLSAPIRDDESAVRAEAERCCAVLGQLVPSDVILELLIPRLLGNLSGYDTAPARTSALLLATHLLTGLTSSSNFTSELSSNLAQVLSSTLSNSSFYLFDDILVHEAALLLIQGILRNLPSPCRTTEVQYHLLLALLYLQSCGQVTQRDKVVIEAARHEIVQLSRLHNLPVGEYDLTHVMDTKTSSSTQSKSQVLASLAIATRAVCSASSNKMETDVVEEIDIFTKYSVEVDSVLTDHFVLLFEYLSSQMQNHTSATLESKALDTLLRMSPRLSWKHGDLVFPVIIPWVQPPPCQQSQQQSDTSNVESMMHHIDTRLTLLALVETLVRAASSNWQCAPHLRRHSEAILKQIVVPNLVWRAGRIEGAIRKVAMAVGYAVLKAGAVESETLLVSATELVPLIVSHLDDSDTTCRLIACPALQILFERLRGSFSPQAVHEIYPKLLKRLDDSCDEVRIAVLESLHFFFKCGPPSYFTGTLIDYSLDQLFIHLDDPNVIVQNTVMATILSTVSIDKDLIVEKAESNRSVHRAPLFCDKILNEILKV